MRLIPILDENGEYLKDDYTNAEPEVPFCYYQICNKFDELIVNHPVTPVYIGDRFFSVNKLPFTTKCLIHGVASHGKLVYGYRHFKFTVGTYKEDVATKLDSLVLGKGWDLTINVLNFRIKGYLQYYAGLHSNYIHPLHTFSAGAQDSFYTQG